MVDEKKSRFADKFKGGGGGFVGSSSGANNTSGGFANRFRPSKAAAVDNKVQDTSSAGSESGSLKSSGQKNKLVGFKSILNKKQDKNMGVAERVRRKRSQNVFLVRGKDRQREAWHYVLVDNNKREMFLAATRSGALDVADYGEVLCSGWGENPPESVVKRVEDEFNL